MYLSDATRTDHPQALGSRAHSAGMRRRRLLAALGAGVAGLSGCSGSGGDGPSVTPAPVPEDAPTTATPQPEPAGASVIEFPESGLTASLFPTTLRTRSLVTELSFLGPPTPQGPARVSVVLTNMGDRLGAFRFGVVAPEGSDLLLVPTESHPGVDPRSAPDAERTPDGCWRLSEPVPSLPLTDQVQLPPGGSLAGEYALVAPAESGCPLPGQYGFGTGERSVTVALWPTDSPGPRGESRFAGRSVPPLGPETAWYHEATSTTPVTVRPDAERTAVPGEIEFRLVNRSREAIQGNGWGLHKLVDGRWYPIRPAVFDEFSRTVPPGDELAWRFRFLGRRPNPRAVARLPLSAGPLGGGTYAFVPDYHDDGRLYAALFELQGSPVTVTPATGLVVERSGGVVEVRSPSTTQPMWTVRLRPTDRAPTLRLIPEQLLQPRYRVFRNSLPLFDDSVITVLLHTGRSAVEAALGRGGQETIIEYQGERYAVGVRSPERG